jgi:5-methylcytosine-specific restriction endonuclease McrA
MADRLYQRCNERSCPNRTKNRGGYCLDHQKDNQRTRQQSDRGHKWYSTAHWQRVRNAFISKYPLRAVVCQAIDEFTGKMCGRPAKIIDHVIPFRGSWELFVGGVDFENLQGMCQACHNKKIAKEQQEVSNDESVKNSLST